MSLSAAAASPGSSLRKLPKPSAAKAADAALASWNLRLVQVIARHLSQWKSIP
jgi:hypothetical protein